MMIHRTFRRVLQALLCVVGLFWARGIGGTATPGVGAPVVF
jgi:hypothetical protein